MSQRNKCVDLQNLKDDRLIVERTRKTYGSPNIRTKQKPEVVRLRVFTGHLLFRLAHRSFSEGGSLGRGRDGSRTGMDARLPKGDTDGLSPAR